ncbi:MULTISPECIES: hypothetical protein [unclassified Stappia]|nr:MULTISPECIES: hypothetical protein [unclassified Stappia]
MIDLLARTYLIALRAEDRISPPVDAPRRIRRPAPRRALAPILSPDGE